MKIIVIFDGIDFNFDPENAFVTVGEEVEWEFLAEGQLVSKIRWIVSFDESNSPFSSGHKRLQITTVEQNPTQIGNYHHITHVGSTPKEIADKPGDYKYGVQALDDSTENKLGDEDPRLIVSP